MSQEPPNQDIVMQPVPCDDTTETHMHSEANGQSESQAPQLAADMGRDPVIPNQWSQPHQPLQHTKASCQTEPQVPLSTAGMGRDPVIPNHAPQPPQPPHPLHQYGLISLFDGCASTHDLITEAAGVPPTVFIAAENDPDIRQYVATRNKWNLDGEWFCKGASHYRYLEDADQLVDNGGAVLKQALALAPGIPYIVIVGAPCQADWLERAAYTSTPFT